MYGDGVFSRGVNKNLNTKTYRVGAEDFVSLDHLPFHFTDLLRLFCVLCLFIQALSLSGSSFAEEEHQFWYYFSVSILVLSATLVAVTPATLTYRWNTVKLVFLILLMDRMLLRQLHRTGNKWIHLPDISDWLYRPEHRCLLWLAQFTAWSVLFGFRWYVLHGYTRRCHRLSSTRCLMYFSPLISLLVLCASQLYYRWTVEHAYGELSIVSARLAYVVLVLDYWITRKWYRRDQSVHHSLPDSAKFSESSDAPLHPMTTFPLFIILLGQPTVGILWTGVLIKEFFVARLFRLLLFPSNAGSEQQSDESRLICCWLIYWIQGWTTFFQQGNSVSLATIDVSAAYVGLRTYQPFITGPLLIVYTYAGPLFWQLAYVSRFSALRNVPHGSGPSLAYFRLGFVTLPLTICATVCFVLQSHLFIWTVFTPKLLYLAVFHTVFSPLLVCWSIKRM